MKLSILCLEPGHHHSDPDSPMWSWAVRELGAEIGYFGDSPERIDHLGRGADVAVYVTTDLGARHPSTDALLRLKGECGRLVMAGTDLQATDLAGTNPLVREYIEEDVFAAIVSLDGSTFWIKREQDWAAFGMFDPAPWEGRGIARVHRLGFQGGPDRKRLELKHALAWKQEVSWIMRPTPPRFSPYQHYIDWMLGCRAVINSGSGQVKGRVNEAALAGCLLFEEAGSLTCNYLTPNVDYVEFTDVRQVLDALHRPDFDDYAADMGAKLRARVLGEWGPRRFWDKVIDG